MSTENTMFLRSLREISTKNGQRHIASFTAPKCVMALADAKGMHNRITSADGERIYRPDVTIFLQSGVAEKVQQALADGKTLSLEADRADHCRIEQAATGNYFVPGETVLSDTKSLRFTVTRNQSAEFEEATSSFDEVPFD